MIKENEINKIPEDHKFQNNSIETENGNKVYFRDIENKLINEIDSADVVLGAVAWIKKDEIISALSKKNVFIIIDKAPIFNDNISKLNHDQLIERAKLIEAYKNIADDDSNAKKYREDFKKMIKELAGPITRKNFYRKIKRLNKNKEPQQTNRSGYRNHLTHF